MSLHKDSRCLQTTKNVERLISNRSRTKRLPVLVAMSTRDIHVENTFIYPCYFCISIKLLIIVVRYHSCCIHFLKEINTLEVPYSKADANSFKAKEILIDKGKEL